MIALILWFIIFIVALFVLIKASDFFTDAAEHIGLRLGLSPFIIGVTIVAIGTSLPELFSSLVAAFAHHTEIVVGNVVGSNIANILLVLGVTAVFARKFTIARELIRIDLPLLVGATFLVALMLWDGSFTFVEGILCLVLLVVYLAYTGLSEKDSADKEIVKEMRTEIKDLKEENPELFVSRKRDARKSRLLLWKNILILLVSVLGIYFGAKYVVEAILQLSSALGLATEVFSLTVVALGTSLPELAVSIQAARKNKAEIALGNILGSNIFNILAVLSIPSFIAPLIVSPAIISFSLPVLVLSTLLYMFITQDREITQWEGALLLIFYAYFLLRLFGVV